MPKVSGTRAKPVSSSKVSQAKPKPKAKAETAKPKAKSTGWAPVNTGGSESGRSTSSNYTPSPSSYSSRGGE